MSKPKIPPPPKHLAQTGKALWRTILSEYDIDRSGREVLQRACEAADRAEQARLAISSDGMLLNDRFGQKKPHPLLAVERDARAATLAAIKQLGLDLEPIGEVGRPAGG